MINRIFRSEAAFLDLKQDFEDRNRIFRFRTGFLDWKQGYFLET